MEKHGATHLVISLLAATTLMCIGVIFVEPALASGPSYRTTLHTIIASKSDIQIGVLPPADKVAEERWARPSDTYVLAEGGQIAAQSQTPAIPGGPERADIWSAKNHTQFDVNGSAVPECGTSPATPEEITHLVIEKAQKYEVDVAFAIAVVTAESRLDRLRNSPKRARGPMQLIPETAERFGVTDVCDPHENIDAGIRYLRELSNEFRNPILVAAAYNAGEGRVREYGGIPPYKETLGYIAEILNIQMGIDGSGVRRQRVSADAPELPSNVSGVITAHERRQWLGGVMHF